MPKAAVAVVALVSLTQAQVLTSSLQGLTTCKYSNGQSCLNTPQTNPLAATLGLGTFKRGQGMCSMMGVTPVTVRLGATQPAYYIPTSAEDAYKNKLKNKFSEWDPANQTAFQLDCPLFYKEQIVQGKKDYLCCTEDQYKVMQTQYRMIGGLCDVSKQVLQNVWCNYACHPSQTQFMDVDQIHFYPSASNASISYPAIEEATYYVGDDWARDVYEYSKGDLIAKVLCQPQAGCNSGMGLLKKMGEYQFNGVGSPNQVNFVAASTIPTADKCSCSAVNQSNCIMPRDGTLPSCAGVCGSVCAASPTPLSYTPGCNNAQTSGLNSTNSSSSSEAWKELFAYMETKGVDFQAVNIGSLIACIVLFFLLSLVVFLIQRRQSADQAFVEYTSYIDTKATLALEQWGRIVSHHPYRVLSVMSIIAIACSIGLYRSVIEVDPIKLWVAESSTAYKERDRFGQLFMPFYRTSQMILRPKDGGNIARGGILKESLILQEKVANLRVQFGNSEIGLEDICWKATGTACTVNSITQYFQNNATHYQVYDQYNLSLAHFQNCLYSPSYADVQTCQKLAALKATLPPSMSDCPCLSSYGAPMDMYTTVLGQFPSGARENVELFKDSKAMLSTILAYNYYDDAQNEMAKTWERKMINFLKEESKRNSVFNIDFMAEVSIADEIALASRSDVTPAALSYVLMIVYVTLGINRWQWRDLKHSFAQAKLLLGFLGIALILLSVLTTIGFFSWCGAHVQIVIMEVVPFLTLAIGVDNIFLLVNQIYSVQHELRQLNQPLSVEGIVSKALGKIGPSILLASCTECLAFVFGCISPMPAVLWFAAFSAAAVLVNFIFQMTMFLALVVLDKRRELARLQQSTSDLQEPITTETTPKVEFPSMAERAVDWYANILCLWPVKIIILAVFFTWTYLSIRSTQSLEQGLNNRDAMPSDSYMISYFDTIDAALETGPPIFYIVESGYKGNPVFDFSDPNSTQLFCKSKSFCAPNAIPKIVEALGNGGRSKLTHMAPGVYYSWLDDFWPFASAQSECCRVDSSTNAYLPLNSADSSYMATRKTSPSCLPVNVATPPIPKDNFMSLFRIFASANAGPLCAHGGGSIYRGQFSIDNQPIPVNPGSLTLNNPKAGNAVTAVSYMAISNANPTQGDYIATYKQARRAAQYMSESTGIQVWVYSIFFCFFDQYLTIVNDTFLLVGLALLVIFIVHAMYFQAIVVPFIVTCVIANACLCVVGLMQPFGILLNGLSVVNLIIAAGVSVEFCSHMARSFYFSKKQLVDSGNNRMKDALHHVMLSVLFGITITKIVGLSALTLCDSRVFQKYYFRMYLTIVICGLLHGMVLLPVLLSLVEDVKRRWYTKRSV